MTLGIRNSQAVKNLLERMLEMVERRKENIWNKKYDEEKLDQEDFDYRFTNVPELRRLCKERNLKNAHIKSKEELVKLLKENPLNSIYENIKSKKNYSKMVVKDLKKMAKERGLTKYNNLKKDELVKLHQDYEEDMKMIDGDVEELKESDNDESDNDESDNDESDNDESDNKKVIENKIISNNNKFLKIFSFNDKQIRTLGHIMNRGLLLIFIPQGYLKKLNVKEYHIKSSLKIHRYFQMTVDLR